MYDTSFNKLKNKKLKNNINLFVINKLDKSDRLKNILHEIKKMGLGRFITIFNPLTIEETKKKCYNYITKEAYNNITKYLKSTTIFPTFGSVSCAISHYKIWEYMNKFDINEAIIIEDDTEVYNLNDFRFSLNLLKSFINKNKNNGIFFSFHGINQQFNSNYYKISNIHKYRNTNFYYINNRSTKTFCKMLLPMTYQIDITIKNYSTYFNNHSSLKFIALYNTGIHQSNKFKSDCQYLFLKIIDIYLIFYRLFDKGICANIFSFLPQEKYLNNLYQYNDMHLINDVAIDVEYNVY